MAIIKTTGLGTLKDSLLFDSTSNGIHLGVTSATASNLLDDYEEGTWTPNVGGTATYTTQTGSYTKIGRLVFVRCQLVINLIGTGSATTLSGLPFGGITNGGNTLTVLYYASLANSVLSINASVGGSNLTFFGITTAATTAAQYTIFQNSSRIDLSGCYEI